MGLIFKSFNGLIWWLKWFGLVGGFLFALLGSYEFKRIHDLNTRGVLTSAKVVKTYTFEGSKGTITSRVKVHFRVEGIPGTIFEKDFELDHSRFGNPKEGDLLPLRYMTNGSSVCELGDPVPPRSGLFFGGLAWFLVGISIWSVQKWLFQRKKKEILGIANKVSSANPPPVNDSEAR